MSAVVVRRKRVAAQDLPGLVMSSHSGNDFLAGIDADPVYNTGISGTTR